jgi:hypothetical protein
MKYIYNGIYIILFNKGYILYNKIIFHEVLIKIMEKKITCENFMIK